jgi:hypothetical protein
MDCLFRKLDVEIVLDVGKNLGTDWYELEPVLGRPTPRVPMNVTDRYPSFLWKCWTNSSQSFLLFNRTFFIQLTESPFLSSTAEGPPLSAIGALRCAFFPFYVSSTICYHVAELEGGVIYTDWSFVYLLLKTTYTWFQIFLVPFSCAF